MSSQHLVTNETKAVMTECLNDALHITSSTTENSSLPQTTCSLMNLLENLIVTSTSTTLTSDFPSIPNVFQYYTGGEFQCAIVFYENCTNLTYSYY